MIARGAAIAWGYDGDAVVLYLSVGEPGPAAGMDIGEGVIVRYDEGRQEVVGLTLIGLRSRLMGRLSGAHGPSSVSLQ